jgi:hypothetical protein
MKVKPKAKTKAKAKAPKAESNTTLKQSITADFDTGKSLFDKYFNFGDLPKIQDNYAKDGENAVSLRGAYADPNNASFAGRRSADVQDILSRMKGGLEGYTANENNAFKERMDRDINQNLSTELKDIEDTNAGNLVLGAAATARADAARREAQKQRDINAQDLFIKNVDEKQTRLMDYGNAVTGAETSEFDKGQNAINAYEQTLNGARQNSIGLQSANIGIEKDNRNAIAAGIGGFADVTSTRRNQNRQDKLMDRFYKKREI